MTESTIVARHREALRAVTVRMRGHLAETLAMLDAAKWAAGLGLGSTNAPEGNALVSLLCAAERVVEALESPDTDHSTERLTEATIRAGDAGTELRNRLAALTPLAELVDQESKRREVAGEFGVPVITAAQLEITDPHAGTSRTVRLSMRGGQVWSDHDAGDRRMHPVDGPTQLEVTTALTDLAEVIDTACVR